MPSGVTKTRIRKRKRAPFKREHRSSTVYDAVAGRVNTHGFIPLTPSFASTRDTPVTSTIAQPPEQVLFRARQAPARSADDPDTDVYSWTRQLPPHLQLPDSDLLKAIHGYASDFYAALPGADASFNSMDGTALVAMGVLLEEMAAEALGETGDLALTESARADGNAVPVPVWWNGAREVPFVVAETGEGAGGGDEEPTESDTEEGGSSEASFSSEEEYSYDSGDDNDSLSEGDQPRWPTDKGTSVTMDQ